MRQLVVLLLTVIMTGCGSYDKRPYEDLKTDLAESRLGAVVYFIPKANLPNGAKKCFSEFTPAEVDKILNPPEQDRQKDEQPLIAAVAAAPLIAAGISFAASYLVDSIKTAIEEYKKGLSGSFGAAGISNIKIQEIACIAIGRGLLGTPKEIPTPDEDMLRELYPKLGFKEYPAFYLELAVESKLVKNTEVKESGSVTLTPDTEVKESGSVTLTPVYLSYAQSIAREKGSGKKHVGVALAFSNNAQKKPEEINEEKAFAVFRHDLGRLEIKKRYDKNLLMGTGASASLTTEAYKKNTFNISAVISDSEDPGLALEVLSTTFTDQKSNLKKALEESITNAINKTKPKP